MERRRRVCQTRQRPSPSPHTGAAAPRASTHPFPATMLYNHAAFLLAATLLPDEALGFAPHIIDIPGLSERLSPRAIVYSDRDNSEAIDDVVTSRYFTAAPAVNNPTIVVIPAVVEDVQACVRHAYDHDLDFGVVGGGHGIAGLGHTNGLLIDMAALTAVSVDTAAGITTYQTGNTIGSLDLASKDSRVYSPNGNYPQVGAGAVLHGGYGAMIKTRGLAIDNIVSYQLVTYDSKLKTVTNESDSDLFWGLRGAASMLGVVTQISVRHFPVDDHYGGSVVFSNVSALPKLVAYINDNGFGAMDEFHVRFSVFSAPPPASVVMEVSLWGDGVAFAPFGGKEAVVNGLIIAAEATVDLNTVGTDAYYEQQSFLKPIVDGVPRGLNEYALTSASTAEALPVAAVAAVAAAFASDVPIGTSFFLNGYGGAFSAVNAADTAFAGRDMKWDFVSQTSWPKEVPADTAADITAAVDALHAAVEAAVGADLSPHAYLNWGISEETHIQKAFGDNLPRLLDLKQATDPYNFFHRNYDLATVGA